jgi:hypothetical protein
MANRSTLSEPLIRMLFQYVVQINYWSDFLYLSDVGEIWDCNETTNQLFIDF